jgi:RNA polymerase sigma-70 factor (ECF subfamily)
MRYPFADKPDDELARAAQGGDEDARERLLDSYHDVLFTLVVRLVGDRERAEAALTRGFTAWFRSLQRASLPRGVRGSLYRMALRAARKSSREIPHDASCSPRAAAALDEELKESGASIGPPDRHAQLQWILAAVPVPSRELIVLLDVMGVTEEQAAFLLGITPAHLPAALERAGRHLLETYAAYGPPHDAPEKVTAATLREEIRGMGWEAAPWHMRSSLRQALRDRRDPVLQRRRTIALVALIVVATAIFLWIVF